MRRLLSIAALLLVLPFVPAPFALAQAHTADAPSLTEGPQTIGHPATKSAQMDNDAVLRMAHAGLSEDLIVQTINTQPGQYDLSPDAVIALKQAGLSETVLNAMFARNRHQITPVKETPIELSPVNEIGVYYKDRTGNWVPLDTEVIHTKSSGFIKNTLSQGIIKTDMNGVVKGPESKLLLPRPIEFLVYTPDGVTISEYDLLLFRLNGKDREFRTLTGGIIHSSGGAQRDEYPFKPQKIAPRTWTFTVDRTAPGGEYGILPPGTGNITNGGKIYTFAITEDDK
jgi:hypothetical protein